ncbi:hypothetical protein GC163_18595 [bacterium]|nr:hypothetical protein [bacterium]
MESGTTPSTSGPRYHGYFQILILIAFVQAGIIGVAAYVGLQKVERAVASIERGEQRLSRVADAADSLGEASIQKAQAVLDRLDKFDPERLGEGTTEGLRQFGNAAKDRAMEMLKSAGNQPAANP